MRKIINLLFLLIILLPYLPDGRQAGYLITCLSAEGTSIFIGLRKEVLIEKNPTNISVVNEIDIIEKYAENVGEAIENTTGITEISKRGTLGSESTIRIRSGGDSSKQVLVMVDGRPVNDTSIGSANLSQITVENIEKIEILRGPASALYGANALGGVVNIITKKAIYEKPRTEIGISYGNFGTQNYSMNFSVKPGKANILFTGSKSLTDGFRENSEYDSLNLFLKTSYDFGKYGELTLSNGLWESELGMPGSNTTPIEEFDDDKEEKASFLNAYQKDIKFFNQIDHKIQIQGTTLKTKLYRDYQKKHYKNTYAFTDTVSKPENLGVTVQVETVYDIISGLESRFEKFRRKDFSVETINKSRENYAVFIQKTFEFDKLSSLTPGIRYDNNSAFEDSINPRLSCVYKLSDAAKLSANIGTAFREPTFEDLYSPYTSWPASPWGNAGDTQGNKDVKPEKSIGTDLGLEFKISEILLSKITLFYTNIKDLIEWKNVSTSLTYDEWRPSNVGKAFSRGVEFEAKNKIIKNLTQNLNYTFLESKGRETGAYKTLQYTPKHRFNYFLNYFAPGDIKTKLSVEYTHKQDWEDYKKHEIPKYTLVGFRVSREILQSEVFFGVNNIFDKRYVSREDYPLPGRTYSGGINMYLWD